MKKILVISAFAPDNRTAGQAFTLKLLQDLSADHQVDLCYFHNAVQNINLTMDNVSTLSAVHLSSFKRLCSVATLPFLHPLFTSRFNCLLALKLRSVVKNYDVVYFDFSQVFVYALFLPHSNKIAMAHDIIAQMYGRRTGWLSRMNAVFSRFSEHFIISRSGASVFCFSDKDCRLAHEYFGVEAKRVDFYLDERISSLDMEKIERHEKFVFYGAWGRRENSFGLLWFINKVMPMLPNSLRFVVVGSGVNEGLRSAAQVFGDAIEFAGFVDNPYDLLAGAKALIAPLFEGAGVKVKVLESLACGTPVIGTDICFEGIDEKHLVLCHSCTSPAEFANTLNTFMSRDSLQARTSFLEDYPHRTMGDVIRNECHEYPNRLGDK